MDSSYYRSPIANTNVGLRMSPSRTLRSKRQNYGDDSAKGEASLRLNELNNRLNKSMGYGGLVGALYGLFTEAPRLIFDKKLALTTAGKIKSLVRKVNVGFILGSAFGVILHYAQNRKEHKRLTDIIFS